VAPMPFNKEKIEKLEKLLVRTEIPFQKKTGICRNMNKVQWLKDNFDIKNSDHPRRNEIMELVEELL
jgi:hypothetical protein